MKKVSLIILILILSASFAVPCLAQKSAADILRAGLLGAGAGAIGGSVSGGKGDDIWKGALAGAGVNIIGGSILDIITSGASTTQSQSAGYRQSNVYYDNGGYTQQRQVYYSKTPYELGYEAGYAAGYKAGYVQGFKDGLKEGALNN